MKPLSRAWPGTVASTGLGDHMGNRSVWAGDQGLLQPCFSAQRTLLSVFGVVSPFHSLGFREASLTPLPHIAGLLRPEATPYLLSLVPPCLALGRCPIAAQRTDLQHAKPKPGLYLQSNLGLFINTSPGLCRCEIASRYSSLAELFPVELIIPNLYKYCLH